MFLVFVLGLIALALAMVLPPLLRRRAPPQPGAGAALASRRANVQVLREQLAALDADHAAGVVDDAQYRLARTEIERRALDEEERDDASRPVVARRATGTAVVLAVTIPVFAVLMYAALGRPQALDPALAAAPQGEVTLPQIEAMVDGLARRLESQTEPQEGDLQAWTMLANSYAVLNRFPEASKAFARARALSPDNAQLLADHADVLAMMQGQSVEGEPGRLVMRALQLEPNNLKALTMAGSWAFERHDYAGAINYWSQAQPLAPPGSEFAAGLENSLQQARAAAAQSGQLAAGTDKATPQQAPGNKPASNAHAAQVSGEVQVTDVLAKRVRPTDTVFVFARATEGPRMPLAIIKRPAGDLPFTFTLDDSSAMGPQFRISGVRQVIVGARISPTGEATPRTGDLTGQIGPVDVGSGKLVLMIDGVVP
ncbi:MAG: c-type cytochrome biogenesis protein CcmI [Rhodoferax sp.]|nr:c-type cytochrome biogenesis protein CcmI [Rhodoferax sp.]